MFVYTAYLDESGTHEGSLVTTMGGMLARADQWRDFEKKFEAVRDQFGFRVWHTKKFKNKAGDFRGWTDEKCSALYWALQEVTSFGLTDVICLSLDNASYEADYKAGVELPRRARLDTRYALCFRICIAHFVKEAFKRRRKNRVPPVHIVMEAGHPNFGDAERVFVEEKKIYTAGGLPILQTLTKANKDHCGQLMMADFAAHSEYLAEGRQIKTGIPRKRENAAVPKGMTPSSHYQFTPEMLRKLRAEIVDKATPKKAPDTSASPPGE